MLQTLYVHNFRCLENFNLDAKELSSFLLIGKNGSGKSTISLVLEIFQSIGRGINRVRDIVSENDFCCGRSTVPIRFVMEVLIEEKLYQYELALELPENFKELRIAEEQLSVEGKAIYSRKQAEVVIHSPDKEVSFLVDWHLVALPIIQEQSASDPLHVFKTWLSRMIILSPEPSIMTGESSGETFFPKRNGSNFGEWISGLFSHYPAAYMHVDNYLKKLMPDLQDILNENIGRDSKNMIVRFNENNRSTLRIDFKELSDGEKCLFLCAALLAANEFYSPLFCFWDEPDSYLSLAEVGHFITALRRAFEGGTSQLLMTSHNPEAIRKFSSENTFFLDRKSHLEPTLIKRLSDLKLDGDLIDTLICGDLEL
jgi:predicted ATPase